MHLSRLTENYAVAEQIQPADVAAIAAQGFVAVQEHHGIIDSSSGPVLGYCRSGQRSMIIWQAGL